MCGILFYFNKNGITKQHAESCLQALSAVKHRGPDGEGVVLINSQTGEAKTLKTGDTPNDVNCDFHTLNEIENGQFNMLLGHRRLSIFDVSVAGHQPMQYHNGNWIVFNGEIYNFFEIKDELKAKGYTFNTATDTEVIFAAYDFWGENCLQKFNGMWAFVLWDNTKKKFFISNDRFGVKPLYHYKDNDQIIVASEVKQFRTIISQLTYNTTNFSVFLESGMLDYDDSTFFNEVKRFNPANYILCNAEAVLGAVELPYSDYYRLKTKHEKIKEKDALNKFSELFNSAVKLRLRSDVPYGVTVSGGVDSSSIVYEVKKTVGKDAAINTFSAVFPGMDGDESEFINFIGTDLQLIEHVTNPLTEFNIEDLTNHLYHQDFPIQSTSFYAEWCVARIAQNNGVKIILNGQGADEVFAGYHHHFYKYCKSLILAGKIIQYLKAANSYAALKSWDVQKVHQAVMADVKLALKLKLSFGKDKTLSNNWSNAKNLTEILKVDLLNTTIPTYLRSDDRDGMAFGIESRHPFMDYRLIDFGFSMPDNLKIKNGWQKWIIREAMDILPDKIRWRTDKKGYTTPQEVWVQKFQKEFQEELGRLKNLNIEEKNTFRHYSLSLWLKKNGL